MYFVVQNGFNIVTIIHGRDKRVTLAYFDQLQQQKKGRTSLVRSEPFLTIVKPYSDKREELLDIGPDNNVIILIESCLNQIPKYGSSHKEWKKY